MRSGLPGYPEACSHSLPVSLKEPPKSRRPLKSGLLRLLALFWQDAVSHLTVILQKVSLSSFYCIVSLNEDPLWVCGMTEDPLWVHRVFNEDPLCVRGMNERMEIGRTDRGGLKNKPSI